MQRRHFLIGAAALAAAPAAAAPFRLPQIEYSAQRYVRQGDRWQEMRVRYAPGMERLDLLGREAGGNVLLLRHDLGRAWLVMPSMAALAELPPEVLGRIGRLFDGTDLRQTGTETVNGVACVRYAATGSFRGTVWLSRSGILVKADGQRQGAKQTRPVFLEQKGIVPASQDASIFEPPAGLLKLQLTDPAWLEFLDDLIG